MEMLEGFAEIAPYLTDPLVLVGFVALLAFGVHWTLIKSGVIPQTRISKRKWESPIGF